MSGKVCTKAVVSFMVLPIVAVGEFTHNQGQCSPALGINEEQSRDGGHDLYGAISKRSIQCLGRVIFHSLEDG